MSRLRYQAKNCYVHRKVGGNDVLISVGANVARFNGYITLNPTASFLWDALIQPRTAAELTQMMTEEFEVSRETAQTDVEQFLEMLTQNDMVTAYGET